MAINGLAISWIWSEDVGRLREFYTGTLGLPISQEPPEMAVLGAGAGPFVGIGTHSNVRGMNADPARHIVGLQSDDIAADTARLKGLGVEFAQEPEDMGHVTVETFTDPDGNLLQLIQSH